MAQRLGVVPPGRARFAAKLIPLAELEALVAQGATERTLAQHFAVSVTTLRRHLAKHELKTQRAATRRDRRLSPGERPLYRELECRWHGLSRFRLESRGYYRCTRCRGDRVQQWRRRKKEQLVQEAGGACSICGYDRYLGALQFHHLRPEEKEFALGERGCTRGIARLREEARKCVLLCSNCHAEVEAGIVSVAVGGGLYTHTPKDSDRG